MENTQSYCVMEDTQSIQPPNYYMVSNNPCNYVDPVQPILVPVYTATTLSSTGQQQNSYLYTNGYGDISQPGYYGDQYNLHYFDQVDTNDQIQIDNQRLLDDSNAIDNPNNDTIEKKRSYEIACIVCCLLFCMLMGIVGVIVYSKYTK